MQSNQTKIHNENSRDDGAGVASQHKVPLNGRHVRFPEDDSIILGCLEPFRPTPDNCTSDELIAAYIASCKLYKTPTVDFLLEQLRGIDLSICNERYSRLCLRGIKLSRFQIETLEEVFRRVHFQEVDLEDTFLDEASATALFDMMLHYETCVDLSISLNLEKFGPSIAWPRCVTYLRKSAALQGFKLSHTPLVTNLFSGLSLSGLSLKSLTFRDCALTGPPLHYLLRLLRYLMTYTDSSNNNGPSKASAGANGSRYPRPSYRGPMAPMPWGLSLHLPSNRIHGADAESLLLLVRHQLVLLPGPPTPPTSDAVTGTTTSACTNKPTGGSGYLEELDLSHNSLRDEGVQVLCSGLLQAYQLQHRRLEVALAAIAQATSTSGTSSATAIMPPKCALPQACGLQRLNLADNGLGNGRAGRYLAAVLRCSIERLAPLLGGLTHLDLSDNPGFGNVGVVDLCDGLVRNFTLRELYLRNVRIGFDGVFALSGYIGETKSLVHLDIRQNTIDIAGMMALTRTLKINGSLTALLLDSRCPTSPSNEQYDMMRILLQELQGYLLRNRSSQVAPPRATLPKDFETFSPKIQTAIERMPSAHVVDEINNPEEKEIKEILLDPPKLAVVHVNDSKNTEEGLAQQLIVGDEKTLISNMETNGNESLSKLKPKQELTESHAADTSSSSLDKPIVEEVRTNITTEASQSEIESLVRDPPMVSGHMESGLPAVEGVGTLTTSSTCNPKVEGSWSSQSDEAMDFITTGVKESSTASLVIEELKTSAHMGAGHFDVGDFDDESKVEFEASQSVNSKSVDHPTNDKLEEGSTEAKFGISHSLEAQTEELSRKNSIKTNVLHNSPTSAVASTSQKSSSEDLLKEAMQQYLDPELAAEVMQEDATSLHQPVLTECTSAASATERSANLDFEASESVDSLFNETIDSPKNAENPLSGEVRKGIFSEWAENQVVVKDERRKESEEGTFKKDPFSGEEAYWDDVEWDTKNSEELAVSFKREDLSQLELTECTKIGDENTFEVGYKSVLDAKTSQNDPERVAKGLEVSVNDRSENTDVEVGELRSPVEGQSVPHSAKNLSSAKTHLPSSVLKNCEQKSGGGLHQLTSKERMPTTLDAASVGSVGRPEKIPEQAETLHTGKSVCMEKCDTFAKRSDDVLLHNMEWGVLGESGLRAPGEENAENVAALKDIPKRFHKSATFAPTNDFESSDFIAMDAKSISFDNEITEPVELMELIGPDVRRGVTESRTSSEPEICANAQKGVSDEKTGCQTDVLVGKNAFEKLQFPLCGDGSLEPMKVNLGPSRPGPASSHEEKEVPNSVLKQLSPTEGGIVNSTALKDSKSNPPVVVARYLGDGDGPAKLSEGAGDTKMRSMGRTDGFFDPILIKTDHHSCKLDSKGAIHMSLDELPNAKPSEEGRLDTVPSVGYENGSDNLPRGNETESDRLSSHVEANHFVTSGSPDHVHQSESIALCGEGTEPALQESLGGILSELSEGFRFKPSVAFDSTEKSANQPPDSTSPKKSELDTENVSWANFEGTESLQQIDEEKMSGCMASDPHDEVSTTSRTVVELSEKEKKSTASERGEGSLVHEPSELLYAGSLHLGSGDEASGSIRALSLDDKHFDSFHSRDEVIRGGESDLKLSVNEGGEIKSFVANHLDPSDRDSIDDANWTGFSAEAKQTRDAIDVMSDLKLLAGDPSSFSVDESLQNPLEDVHSLNDLASGEFVPKNGAVESKIHVSVSAKERVEDTLTDANWNDLGQPKFDTKSVEISSSAAEYGTDNESEEVHFKESENSDNLHLRMPWTDVGQIGDLRSSFTGTTDRERNTKSDEPIIGCKADSSGSDGWQVDDWGTDLGRLQESSDQFHLTDLLDDTTPSRNLENSRASSTK